MDINNRGITQCQDLCLYRVYISETRRPDDGTPIL